jgi:hypothetical protein
MSLHPTIAAALAEEHRRDLTARAETYRIARAARTSGPVPARCTRNFLNLLAAVRRPITHLPLRKVPAAPRPS